jgi:hypothetical protein
MKGECRWVLEQLESGLESWARYPCALTAAETTDESDMEIALWQKYLVCMKASRLNLRHLLLRYMKYYNGTRTHLSLKKDAPVLRAVDRAGHILCRPIPGGLHHRYARI